VTCEARTEAPGGTPDPAHSGDSQRCVPDAEPLEITPVKPWLPGDVGCQQEREHRDVGDSVRTGTWEEK